MTAAVADPGTSRQLQLLTLEEAAGFLRMSTDTLQRWCREGRGPKARKLSIGWRILASDLEAYILNGVGPQS